jgi:hypothetical protein
MYVCMCVCVCVCVDGRMDVHHARAWTVMWILFIFGTQEFIYPTLMPTEYEQSISKIRAFKIWFKI